MELLRIVLGFSTHFGEFPLMLHSCFLINIPQHVFRKYWATVTSLNAVQAQIQQNCQI